MSGRLRGGDGLLARRAGGWRPLGGDGLLQTTVDKIFNANSAGALHVACAAITMELLHDLLDVNAAPMINETQFAGLHLDNISWRPVGSGAHVPGLIEEVTSARDALLARQGAGHRHQMWGGAASGEVCAAGSGKARAQACELRTS